MPEDNSSNPVEVIDEWVSRPDGIEIYTRKWKSVIDPPVATVVFLHGFGDHVNRYNHVFDKFALKGVEVFGYDQRGFGKTAARYKNRGQTGGWKIISEDITGFLIDNRRPGIPQFLFGHSMGGGLASMYAADGPERDNLAGLVLSSPFIELAPQSKKPRPVLVLGSVLSKAIPNLPIPISLDKNFISRNPKEIEKYDKDPLIHKFGSLRGLMELHNGTRLVLKEKYKNITLSIYICFGTADGINDCNAARDFIEKIPFCPSQTKTWREYPGFYHEMHYEDDRDIVINDYLDWIIKQASSPSNSENNIQISTTSESAVSPSPLAPASA